MDHQISERDQKKIYFSFIDYAKAFDCVDHKKAVENPSRWEYQTTWPASWEICMQVKKLQLEPDTEQWTVSKLGKEYVKAVYCHPAYLTKEPLDKSERGEWKSWLKTQHSEN